MYIIYFKNGAKLKIDEREHKDLVSEDIRKYSNFIDEENPYLTINGDNINFIIDEKLESERVVKESPMTFTTTLPNNTGTNIQ